MPAKALLFLLSDFGEFKKDDRFEVFRRTSDGILCKLDDGLDPPRYTVIPNDASIARIQEAPGEILLECSICKSVLSIPRGSVDLAFQPGWRFESTIHGPKTCICDRCHQVN